MKIIMNFNNNKYNLLYCLIKNPNHKEPNPEIVKKINCYKEPLYENSLREKIMPFIRSKRHLERSVLFTHYLVVYINYRYEKVGDKFKINYDNKIILTKPESNKN